MVRLILNPTPISLRGTSFLESAIQIADHSYRNINLVLIPNITYQPIQAVQIVKDLNAIRKLKFITIIVEPSNINGIQYLINKKIKPKLIATTKSLIINRSSIFSDLAAVALFITQNQISSYKYDIIVSRSIRCIYRGFYIRGLI